MSQMSDHQLDINGEQQVADYSNQITRMLNQENDLIKAQADQIKGPSQERVMQEVSILFKQQIQAKKSSIQSKLDALKRGFEELRKLGRESELNIQNFNMSQSITQSLDYYYQIDRKIQDREITGSNEEERNQILRILEKVLAKIKTEEKRVELLEQSAQSAKLCIYSLKKVTRLNFHKFLTITSKELLCTDIT